MTVNSISNKPTPNTTPRMILSRSERPVDSETVPLDAILTGLTEATVVDRTVLPSVETSTNKDDDTKLETDEVSPPTDV
jgi:hypothetical protein